MSVAIVLVISVLVVCALACRADVRFRSEDRLPMQWWITGEVTWSAPRRLALAFMPALAMSYLASLRSRHSMSRPVPGRKGSYFRRRSVSARRSSRYSFYTFGLSQGRCASRSVDGPVGRGPIFPLSDRQSEKRGGKHGRIIGRVGMRIWHIALLMGLGAQSAVGEARSTQAVAVPTTRQLDGLGPQDATGLIVKLEDAQRRLKAGTFASFELLAGSVASYDETRISPRDAFLRVPFKSVWRVERLRSDNELWQPYRLAYAPEGLGHRYWDIEVVLGVNGDIERISMIYKPPAPS